MNSWHERVAAYVDDLSQIVEDIDVILNQARVDSSEGNHKAVERSTHNLQQSLADLEHTVAERDELIRAADAPPDGATLTEKLNGTGNDADADLAQRCDTLATRISSVHQRSVAIFVCQYHLADLTTDLVRLIVGDDQPMTYQAVAAKQTTFQGGLLNESA